ncbi:hypothetical protein MMC07_009734 [Pseudocyphellaria aurata]|nr:hypothetical protein [Pseudocyphellaria aurata]
MLNLCIKAEVEKRYRREVQQLCKTSSYGIIIDADQGEFDQKLLEAIVSEARDTAPHHTNFVLSVNPVSCGTTEYGEHVTNMKTVAVLAILCKTAHCNNSNYLPLLLALYLYSAGARVDAITVFNHLWLSVSYQVLQKKLQDLAFLSMDFIKQQSTNRRLVGTWDNFEYCENVHGERIGDTVKFRLVTMALWVKNGWKIPPAGLKLRKQCIWSHRSHSFKAAFPDEKLDISHLSIPIVDRIDYSKVGATEAHAFAPSMFSESSTAGNILVFKDLNVIQMGIEKDDPRWDDWLTLWWGDLKTKIQMESMQKVNVAARKAYDCYQHIFPGLALWHLRFNYLKMVWEVFYPGRSANERSSLQ